MGVHYCDGWFAAKKVATEIWDEARARRAHQKRETYTALLGNAQTPSAFVEVRWDSVAVGFLDRFLREQVSYSFSEEHPGRLFLSMAVRQEYEGDTDRVTRGGSFTFNQDGTVIVHRQELVTGMLEKADIRLDVSQNWERWPEFGDYTALVRRERERHWRKLWGIFLSDWPEADAVAAGAAESPPQKVGYIPLFPELADIEVPLRKLSAQHGVAFCAAIAERFWARYNASSGAPEWAGEQAAEEALERIWTWLSGAPISREAVEELHARWLKLTYDLEKYPVSEACYAEGICAGITGAAECILIQDAARGAEAARDARRAMNWVVYGLLMKETGAAKLSDLKVGADAIENHPLILGEIAREEEDLRILQDQEITPGFLHEFRRRASGASKTG